MRQLGDSGILYNATKLREIICNEEFGYMPKIKMAGFPDICRVSGEELIEAIESSYNDAGTNETIVLCRSNKRANVYNEGIRRRTLEISHKGNSIKLLDNRMVKALFLQSKITLSLNL